MLLSDPDEFDLTYILLVPPCYGHIDDFVAYFGVFFFLDHFTLIFHAYVFFMFLE